MILSGHWTSRGEVFRAGLKSRRWLVDTQRAKAGHFAPIGCNGFWKHGGKRARFDQQPIEAYATISACLEAFALTRDEYWKRASRRCFEWFLGRNDLGESLYDSSTGGCRDALHQDRVSQNQGAESSLAFYLSLAEMTQAEAAPLFNPSIVPHPDQSRLSRGDLRFILSLRSNGEGHISSIQFRTGVIHHDHSIEIDKTTPFVTLPELNPKPTYHKRTFLDKLSEMGLENDWAASVMGRLGKTFLFDE